MYMYIHCMCMLHTCTCTCTWTVCVYLGSHKPVSGAHGSGQNMEHTQGQFEEGALIKVSGLCRSIYT